MAMVLALLVLVSHFYGIVLACTHEIYCQGRLLHEVQTKSVFPDSKTFVDMKLKVPWPEIVHDFYKLLNSSGEQLRKAAVKNFVKQHFEPVGSEFEAWNPPDWTPKPLFLKKIKDPVMWEFGKRLHNIWKVLGRKITELVRENQELYSIIYVPYGMIVPGGRFREMYYWDSYWIIRGLLKSEMFYTARGIITNFVYMVRQYGLVPNGGRIYYAGRSQPPLLLPMVKSYMDATNDIDFLREHLDTLEKEYAFWLANRTVVVTKGTRQYRVARYSCDVEGPRPEAYRQDFERAKEYSTDEERQDFYAEVLAASESGQDDTSRWLVEDDRDGVKRIKTRSIVPVDLNAIMCWNARILSRFCEEMGLRKKALAYRDEAASWRETVHRVLWHEDLGTWLDYDLTHGLRRDAFYATNLAPLWTGCYLKEHIGETADKVLRYIDSQRLLRLPGGIPASMVDSGLGWDFPNAWPPLQDLVVSGLEATDDPRARRLAREWALTWVYNSYRGWEDMRTVHGVYDVRAFGRHGTGVEEGSLKGFAWNNGVILDFLDRYAEQLVESDVSDDRMAQRPELDTSCKLCVAVALLASNV